MTRGVLWAAFVVYCAVIVFGAVVHEPWWDEAQAWLIARDATLPDLFLRHLAYEGHPPLWYLLLMIPARLGLPYASLAVVAALTGAAGVYILLFHVRTLPLVIRVVAPFTFYLAYQYTVVARSYVLLGATMWAIAAIYEERAKRFPLFALLLAILAGVSVHGFALALGFAALFVIDAFRGRVTIDGIRTRGAIAAIAAFLLWSLVLVVVLWPPGDVVSKDDLFSPLSPMRYVQLYEWIVPELFWGEVQTRAVVPVRIAATVGLIVFVVWLARCRFALPFFVLTAAVLGVSGVYYSPWHEGLFFFVVIFSAAVAFGRAKDDWLTRVVAALLVLVLARHVQWTVMSLRYDARHEFTGSESAARYIRERGIHRRTVFGLGTRNVELQPYFDANLFANYRFPAGAMWDWSTQNAWPYPRRTRESNRAMRDWYVANMARQPEYVVCSIGFRNDHLYAVAMGRNPDYRLVATFDGRTYWKRKKVEVIAFQLFQRVASAPTASTSSASPASTPPRNNALGR